MAWQVSLLCEPQVVHASMDGRPRLQEGSFQVSLVIRLSVVVRDGIVHLSGIITDERSRQAAVVAAENVTGVRKVHDHLVWIEPMSGVYLNSAEDEQDAKAS